MNVKINFTRDNMFFPLEFFKALCSKPSTNTLSVEEYLKLRGPSEPRMPELGKGLSFQYLQELKEYLIDLFWQCSNQALINFVKAAKDSITHEGHDKKKVFEILLFNIYRFKELIGGEKILEYKDEQGMTALHHLTTFGDEWHLIIEILLFLRVQLGDIPDEKSVFPIGLAADRDAYDIFMIFARDLQQEPAMLATPLSRAI